MPAQNTDKFKKVAPNTGWQVGGGGVADAEVTTVPLNVSTGIPNDTAVLVTIDRVDASGNKTPSKMERIVGVVNDNNIVNCIRGVEGTAQSHAAGAVVEIVIASKLWNDMVDGILAEHNQDGSHSDVLMNKIYPVGSVYINYSDNTNPGTLLGFGTWVATAVGRAIVGLDAGQTEFDTAGETGGAKTHTLTAAQSGVPAHTHNLTTQVLARGESGTGSSNTATSGDRSVAVADALANTAQNASSAHNNLQPYQVFYVWRRTA